MFHIFIFMAVKYKILTAIANILYYRLKLVSILVHKKIIFGD